MSIIAFIPVRAGSKSIKGKNIRSFCGKPLIYWTLNALNQAPSVDRIYTATDGDEIAETVSAFGLEKVSVYRRRPENAEDHSSTESVMLEFLQAHSFDPADLFLLVQATSPLTESSDIEDALRAYGDSGADSLLACTRTRAFFWNEDGTPVNYDFRARPRRQDFRGTLRETGAFYISSVGAVLEHKNRLSGKILPFELPEHKAVDIDEEADWEPAEVLMRKYVLGETERRANVELFLTDVDGVLTDAGMYYGESGDELKKFNTRDGMGLELLRRRGIKTGIITSENTDIVARRAKKLKVDYLYQGAGDKLSLAREICAKEGISLENVAYIGDDVNDLELLKAAGLAACPADAVSAVRNLPGIHRLKTSGGAGAVREFVELIP